MHPLNPRHPQYATLVAAGRAPSVTERADVERDPLACAYTFEDRYGEVVCNEPATNVVARADGRGVQVRLCDRDLHHYVVPSGAFVVARVSCSSCDRDAKRYELDDSGRCDECRP